ncbi:uncharacterized protein PHACADRAFT_191043 [Phanerochaete carnosa HHB-10118-sp]|uniref:Uncharacterized protein n=1 Tax=Phanerochaete carnosa (strain HHB-10118-sp) TaxID=650164 RepID=K5WQX1_PHACS|nr:uncharacterized protein PHACADRAFT_191043 [Phanerochaete carnosa HHB-10118-sp]EKM61850.1 hypothetical protein PHACADRAFT_191043 [Phanerochaete carnosa HHB-10118-sp]
MLLAGEPHLQALNVKLHMIYGLLYDHLKPYEFNMLSTAVVGLHPALGIPLFALLLTRIPRSLFVYALAAQFSHYDLAACAPMFLLSTGPSSILEECAQRTCAVYLNRLLGLQTRRVEVIKENLR